MSFFPNPTRDELNVVLSGEIAPTSGHLLVYDTRGRLVLERPIDGYEQQIDTRTLPAGLYHYRALLPDGQIVTQRVTILR